ncbi:VRR-NUC domain-containing protein, partial [Pseudomonadota bacterium]
SSDFVDGRLQTEELNLVQHGPGKWESPVSGDHCRPEIAVFDHFRSNGWSGSYREGDLIFLLLQLMMFKKIPISACDEHHKLNIFNAFENPDNQNWPYNTWGKIENRISNIRKITTSEIGSNFDRLTEKPVMCQGVSEWYDPYREISRKMMEDFSRCFSRDQLVRLAKSLADPRNSYRFSYGWPDLTLYKDGKVIFREVKTENDTLRINQEQLYDEVLGPFGFDTKIINLLPGGSGISP